MTKLPRRRPESAQTKVDTARIVKLLRLMLCSDQQGEVFAAASALRRTLAADGLDHHDLAAAVANGLKPAEEQEDRSWRPPLPNLTNWESMAWYCHYHRHRLRKEQAERVAEYLLGTAFEDGVCRRHDLQELQLFVAVVRAAR